MRLRYLLPLCLVFFACAEPKLSTVPEDVVAQIMSGHDLTPGQAALLEKKLKQDPHDLASRTQLLGYYFYRGPKKLPTRPEIEAREQTCPVAHTQPAGGCGAFEARGKDSLPSRPRGLFGR